MYWTRVQRNVARWPTIAWLSTKINWGTFSPLQNFWNVEELLITISDYLKYETLFSLKFVVFTAVLIHIMVFGVMTPCCLACCVHPQGSPNTRTWTGFSFLSSSSSFLSFLGILHTILIQNFNNPQMLWGGGKQHSSNGMRRVVGMNIGCSFVQ
jgi:hypothetical protein